MSEEEKKVIEELEKFINQYEPYVFYSKQKGDTAEINPYVKKYETYKTILNLIENQNKIIDLMAKQINEQNDILYDYDNSISYLPCNADVPMNKCLKNECVNCIKEYFRKESEKNA